VSGAGRRRVIDDPQEQLPVEPLRDVPLDLAAAHQRVVHVAQVQECEYLLVAVTMDRGQEIASLSYRSSTCLSEQFTSQNSFCIEGWASTNVRYPRPRKDLADGGHVGVARGVEKLTTRAVARSSR